ncbi:hypothetical protein MtrunA17_Chr5g0427091 [Medicago truncatula]|uniref:Uncharacterized protein n=1 Tax=Medicago truncatula TaxID=3880 RepID=A0A396HUN6_MEDTR|nr:hypothetical protein MtrunA17_Chr5g0427091 [Medicago truncatula]
MQKDAAMGMNSSNADAMNGSLSAEKPAERAMVLSVLKNSIEEAKIVNSDRLSELQDAREGNQILTKQFQELQAGRVNVAKWKRPKRILLKRSKDAALKAVALREKAHSFSEIEWEGYSHKLPFHFLSHLLCDWSCTEIYLNNLSL